MANCTITDRVGYWSAAGSFTGTENALVYAVPDASYRRLDVSGTYRPLGVNPNIATAAYQRGRVSPTDSNGEFSFALPYSASATKPTTPAAKWTIVLPSGDQWTGEVPSVAGPLTLDDLASTYGWTQANAVYVAPVTAGVLARGTASFSAAEYRDVVFVGGGFSSSAYQLKLTPSVDSVTGNVPGFAYESKTASGFRIRMAGEFTGFVDWEASL